MKKYSLFLFVIFVSTALQAQVVGNEWIVPEHSYYKVKVFQNGLYRLSHQDMQAAGVPNGLDPRRFQLFHRGQEQAIFVKGPDGSPIGTPLGNGDYIEFYGKQNDGAQDQALYIESAFQPHTHYNLFSDTSAYFLTWNLSSTNNQRMALFTDVDAAGLPVQIYHLNELLQVRSDVYRAGRDYPTDVFKSAYDLMECWSGLDIAAGIIRDYTFSITNAVPSGPVPNLQIQLIGVRNQAHSIRVEVGTSTANLREVQIIDFAGYSSQTLTIPLAWSDLGANLVIRLSGISGRSALTFAKLVYAQNFSMAGLSEKTLFSAPNPGGRSLFVISNAPAAAQVFDITDPQNVRRISLSQVGSNVQFILNNTQTSRKILVKGSTSTAAQLQPVRFRSINRNTVNYIAVTHPRLTRPVSGSANPVRDYLAYRASASGGGYDTLSILIGQIYDQFGYGEESPLALRRFALWMAAQGSANKHFFLIGKPIGMYTRVSNQYYRKSPQLFTVPNLVPTFGFPSSDNIFSSPQLDGVNVAPQLITGRLNARTAQEVKNYLDKVREMEQSPTDALWRKNQLYLSGGVTSFEVFQFRQYVNQFKSYTEGPYLGGSATIFTKQTNNASEVINVSNEVNNGVGLIMFFGHASAQQTDIDIGTVTDNSFGYANAGKYPFFLVNGCIAGVIDDPVESFGENWMLAANRGATGFLAHSNQGRPVELKLYTDIFLKYNYGDSSSIGNSMGDNYLKTIKDYLTARTFSGTVTVDVSTQAQQFLLQGDPAYRIFKEKKPDYAIRTEDIYLQAFNDQPITALSDSFALGLIVRNFGITSSKPLQISVQRTLTDGQLIYNDTVAYQPVYYQDTLLYTIRSRDVAGFGLNRFEVILDLLDSVAEFNETNNRASIDFFISLGGTVNLLPYDQAVINTQTVVLKSQSADILSAQRDYLFELDTTAAFTSPFKKSQTVNAQVLAEWSVNLLPDVPANDSTVYYWRSKYANPQLPMESDEWSISSFTFIRQGQEGANVSSAAQWQNGQLTGLEISPNGRWNFKSGQVAVDVTTYGVSNEATFHDVQFAINSVPYIYTDRYCGTNSINAVAFDKSSGEPYKIVFNPGFDILDPLTCGRRPQVINHFPNAMISNLANDNIRRYFDGLPEGDFVVFFSIDSANMQTFVSRFRDDLLGIGATTSVIDNLQNGSPFIIFGRQGQNQGSAQQITGSKTSVLNLNQTFPSQFSSGTAESSRIGPAVAWGTSQTDIQNQDPEDDYFYDIIGIDNNGNQSTLFSNIQLKNVDLSTVNSNAYPYLKIRLRLFDIENLTPPQPKRWLVQYTPAPEGVLLPNQDAIAEQVTIPEGKNLQKNFRYINISNKNFQDSIVVNTTTFNQSNRTFDQRISKIKPLPAGESVDFSLDFRSRGKVGVNDFRVYVNPQVQAEQLYSNNILSIPAAIKVEPDKENPLMEVTFDGQRIMNGDIVSPSPLIGMRMKDNNPFLFKQDTSGVEIYLKSPCESCAKKRIAFSDPLVSYTPASPDQDFEVEYRPEKLADGMYELEVQMSDESGNLAGNRPYSISFEVINASTITHFYPYPNPFSTKMWFVFTLTGEDIPDQIKIQIMTVTGRVIREITQDEIGPLRIGNNRTQYAWDGRDEFGDLLANGVYLYKVFIKSQGKNIDHRKTSADKAFDKGFGKLYILR